MRVFGMVLLCETLCSFAPLLAPCSPHLPRPASSFCPSCVSVCPVVFFFSWSRSLLLPRAPRVPPALLRATPVPLPCAPSLACLPSHSPSRCQPCLYVCPPCLCRAVTRVSHPRALPLPLSLAPTLSPGCSLGPCLSPHPGCLAPCVCVWGGVYMWSGLWPCPRSGMAVGCLRTMSHRMCRMNTGRTPGRRLWNSCRCICIVEPSRIDKVRTRLHLVGVP